mmetsp:Transcript_12208/g.24547  ORF Transcript_12208/g.24547 Transcript_12208/m.24547 type:complete len:122 (-) Transcript_12208:821-1186(-)|eukprot:CAMPEP_0118801740 /NCGR_PEP_ID=MMETSP1161-20130426/3192_1 /TAXON_ID=249345 /ORGANISM="Picochlorum oklahomensis, Strain CCMP2329" /LENGTH=121 /DNA_ID=CAMNT_0006729715 /DNA_START=231 /DNA_END=596 /DNA_ORIENTATION=-
MAELMQQQQQQGGGSEEEQKAAESRRAREEEERRAMLAAILLPEARERLSRIGLVKPEKSRAIEDMIIGAARRGALSEKVSESRLIELLEQVNEQSGQRKTTVTIQRRRMAFDSDDDDDDL